MDDHAASGDLNSEEEEYMRLQYFEALRRAEEQNMMQGGSEFRQGQFRTPDQPDYFHYYVYGTEKDTASAVYRPLNSSTSLRRKPPKGPEDPLR